jgi:KaiC/GvpD/RAD55 family RecA-like ATPase
VQTPPDDDYVHTDDDAPAKEQAPAVPAAPATPPATPSSIVASWQAEGEVVRLPTGIAALDKLCRGGLPVPRRVTIIGPPSAGKTMIAATIGDHVARAAGDAGACFGMCSIDEEPDDVTVRLLQRAGYSITEAEQRDPEVLRQMAAAIAALPIRLYDLTWTIEAAAADLAAWAKASGRRAVLVIDSLQTARSAGDPGRTPRDSVEANVRAMRAVSNAHRLLVIATSEANRRAYQNEAAAQESNDMAAGAETRAIEFSAETLLMLRTPKDESDIINVKVVKNRRAYVGEFWLRLDRERHRVTECDDPAADPDRVATREQEKRQGVKASVLFDAEHLAGVLRCHPGGFGERALRAELRAQGFGWGTSRLAAAKAALTAGHKGCRLVEVSEGPGKAKVSKLEIDHHEERAAE